jgi:hypothetical protein
MILLAAVGTDVREVVFERHAPCFAARVRQASRR